jgi:hypothetical protein
VAPRLRDGGGSDAEAHERFRHGEWSGRGKRDRCPGSYRAIGDGSRRRHFAPVAGTFCEIQNISKKVSSGKRCDHVNSLFRFILLILILPTGQLIFSLSIPTSLYLYLSILKFWETHTGMCLCLEIKPLPHVNFLLTETLCLFKLISQNQSVI